MVASLIKEFNFYLQTLNTTFCGMTLPYCKKCGAELPENANFCTKCGTPVTEQARKERERRERAEWWR